MRGRPPVVDKDLLIDCLIKYKDQIVQKDQRIISKHNPIWITVAQELNNGVTPYSLYTL